MNLSILYDEIAADEGKRLSPYLCSENHLTIGIGHKCVSGDPYDSDADAPDEHLISEERCRDLFAADVINSVEGCRRLYSDWDTFPDELQHILVNMVFQMGAAGVGKFRMMKAAMEDGDFSEASLHMLESRWARQTPNRANRLSERMAAL